MQDGEADCAPLIMVPRHVEPCGPIPSRSEGNQPGSALRGYRGHCRPAAPRKRMASGENDRPVAWIRAPGVGGVTGFSLRHFQPIDGPPEEQSVFVFSALKEEEGKKATFYAFARKQTSGWLSKKRQMQGAQLSINEAYLRTLKRREQLQQRSSW